MLLKSIVTGSLLVASSASLANAWDDFHGQDNHHDHKLAPKVFIVSMFEPETTVWWGIKEFNLIAHNISLPGLSPIYPDVHCTENYEVCQVTTGESEINAATTITSLALSSYFDLTKTYFMIAGIAGINPEYGTTGSVAIARFAVQVALQYEIDPRELPSNYSTGYIPLGATAPGEYPENIYGTEVFELNEDLRAIAVSFAKTATLNDSTAAAAYRAKYATADGRYKAATEPPSIIECDIATSDVYYSGTLLSEGFGNFTTLLTNGTGEYCTTAQEDNATLEALLRAAYHKLIDFSRIIAFRTASDFERQYPGESALYDLFYAPQDGFDIAVANIYNAGIKIVEGILNEWDDKFERGIKPTNYIGDIFGTLGGTPDFGPGRAIALQNAGVDHLLEG
ncbi:purine nucleoside permease [Penicillium sp. IBT 16267x]|nr:purine nucleoside permease [Penicillium sp. IBT 16267x]